MKLSFRIVTICLFTFLFCHNTFSQQTRLLQNFDGVSISGNIEAILSEGEKEQITIRTREIPEDKVNVKIVKGILKVQVLKAFISNPNEMVKVEITYQKLRSIKGSAGATIRSRSPITGDKITIRASSGADVELDINANTIDGAATEGGKLYLRGEIKNQYATASTGGSYSAFDLISKHTEVKANTGGQAEVFAAESIDIIANVGGSVSYMGNPSQKYTKSGLAGTINEVSKKTYDFQEQ